MRLEGKTAIVTGAAQGMGRSYAERFLAEGAKVVLADLNEELGQEVAEELSSAGETLFVKVDISDEDSAKACAAAAKERFGSVDILINNAALYGGIDFTDQSLDYLRKMFDINVHGSWLMIRAVAPTMVENGWGRIVNQGSGSAWLYGGGGPEEFTEVSSAGYALSKWTVVGLTKMMAAALGKFGITVNCISPGVVTTESTTNMMSAESLEAWRMNLPLRKLLEPSDVTGAAVFFASSDADKITGQTICIDSGQTMPV